MSELKVSLEIEQLSTIVNLLRAILVDMLIIRNEIEALRKQLRIRKPGPVGLRVTREVNDMLQFVLTLPAVGASEVVDRELTVQIGDQQPEVYHLTPTAEESQEYAGNEGDTVSGQLVDIDEAPNRSEPRTFSFVLVDTIAPPMPGEVGLRVTGET